jgi:hypothetical protein
MYQSSDVLTHFKGICVFLETIVQHAARQKEETIYCPYKVWKNDGCSAKRPIYIVLHVRNSRTTREVIREHLIQSDFMDNYFIWTKHGETQQWIESILDERAEENMDIPDDVYSHHDDGCENEIGQDDADHGDEGFDVEELMCNIVTDVLLRRRNKGFDNFEMLDKASRDLLYEECKKCDKEHTVL